MIVLILPYRLCKVSAFFLISEVFGGIYLRRGVFARLAFGGLRGKKKLKVKEVKVDALLLGQGADVGNLCHQALIQRSKSFSHVSASFLK